LSYPLHPFQVASQGLPDEHQMNLTPRGRLSQSGELCGLILRLPDSRTLDACTCQLRYNGVQPVIGNILVILPGWYQHDPDVFLADQLGGDVPQQFPLIGAE
jgi:hypothetical protein